MNQIKYLHPGTGETKRVRILQPSATQLTIWWRTPVKRRGTMNETDEQMAKKGFVRCGIRWGKAKHVKTARRLEAKEKVLAK